MDKVITRDKVRSGLRIDTLTPLKVAVPVLINDVSVVMISSGSGEKPHNGIVAVIPAYNEERFIGSIVLKVRQQAGTVIVVDDGSNDCTSELAATCGAVVIRHIENHGKGTALNTGFNLARQYKPDAVVMLDADGQHLSDDLMRVAAPILDGRADIAIGSRYLQSTSRVPRHRIWGHWGFNLFTRLTSGESCTDSQSGYRAFSLHALECIDFRSEGFSVESEMQFLAHEKHLRIVEVPITIRYQDKPKRSVIQHGLSVLNGILHLVGQYRPLLFFGVPGFLATLVGIGLGMYVVDIYTRLNSLAAGYAMVSIILVITGMVLFTTGIILHSIRGLLLSLLKDRNS